MTILTMRVEKKIWPEFFEQVQSGKKNFEVRLNDAPLQEGDVLVLNEWNPETKEYTGRVVEKVVSYVLRTKDLAFWSQEDVSKHGLQILGLQ